MDLLYAAAAFLVGGGASLAFALGWLRMGTRRRRRVLDEVLALRRGFEDDPLNALRQTDAWVRMAGLRGLAWEGEWYGVPVAGAVGVVAREPVRADHGLERTFLQPDVHLTLRVDLRGIRGEARLFAEQAAQWLFVVFEGALAARELALRASMAQRARLAVFVQHDMRNLAQWVELVAEDIEAARSPEALLATAGRLQAGAGAARELAQRIASAMPRGTAAPTGPERIDLQSELVLAGAMHQVALQQRAGDSLPALSWSRDSVRVVLDNVLGNISRIARERRQPALCTVSWAQAGEQTRVHFDSPELKLDVPLTRIFEPWAGSSPGGWGLGLYQARKVVTAAGGQLSAEACGAGLRVTLSMTCKNS
jgi:signal transduction histidine kinase